MKTESIPFRKLSPNDIARMWLPVTIINPAAHRSFLNHFILTVDYPHQVFSLETLV